MTMQGGAESPEVGADGRDVRTFHLLVANTVIASTANNFLWFALVFWVYLETRSVVATSVIGGVYMLLFAASGIFFGTFVDAHNRKTSMMLSSVGSLACFLLATIVYFVAPEGSIPSLSQAWTGYSSSWSSLAQSQEICDRLRCRRRSPCWCRPNDTTGPMVWLVPPMALRSHSPRCSVAWQSVSSEWARAWSSRWSWPAWSPPICSRSESTTTRRAKWARTSTASTTVDFKGAMRAVRFVPGLLALLLFSTFNNFLAGVFMALMDPYGLELVSVEVWGIVLSISSFGFIVGGVLVASRGLGSNPVRSLLLVNVALWTITILFPIRSSIIPLAIGFFIFMTLMPVAEASEQTIIQKVVPFREQGRVFGFAQTLETAASPLTTFLIGPIAQAWVIPYMTDGAGADPSEAGSGPDRNEAWPSSSSSPGSSVSSSRSSHSTRAPTEISRIATRKPAREAVMCRRVGRARWVACWVLQKDLLPARSADDVIAEVDPSRA